jgi:hypothetical protein
MPKRSSEAGEVRGDSRGYQSVPPEKVRRYLAAHPMPHDTFYDLEGKAADA